MRGNRTAATRKNMLLREPLEQVAVCAIIARVLILKIVKIYLALKVNRIFFFGGERATQDAN